MQSVMIHKTSFIGGKHTVNIGKICTIISIKCMMMMVINDNANFPNVYSVFTANI